MQLLYAQSNDNMKRAPSRPIPSRNTYMQFQTESNTGFNTNYNVYVYHATDVTYCYYCDSVVHSGHDMHHCACMPGMINFNSKAARFRRIFSWGCQRIPKCAKDGRGVAFHQEARAHHRDGEAGTIPRQGPNRPSHRRRV